MIIELKISTAIKKVFISDEQTNKPIVLVDGKEYGPKDLLPIWPDDELSWLNQPAKTVVASSCLEMQKEGLITSDEVQLIRKFYNES